MIPTAVGFGVGAGKLGAPVYIYMWILLMSQNSTPLMHVVAFSIDAADCWYDLQQHRLRDIHSSLFDVEF